MPEALLMDAQRASRLVFHLADGATSLNASRAPLRLELAEAGELLGRRLFPHDVRLRSLAETTRSEAEDLARRWRIAIGGGADFNAGMRALAELTADFEKIETQDGRFEPDGTLSRADLEWAAEHGEAAAAARWLLGHPGFLDAVTTATDDHGYLDTLGSGDFVPPHINPFGHENPLTLDAVSAFERHVDAWVTTGLFAAQIDTAARGGDPDGRLSEEDFEVFLSGADLPPDVEDVLGHVLEDEAYHRPGGVDFLTVLEALSFVPVAGDVIDFGLMSYYLSHGDYPNALAHGLGLVPLPGVGGGSLRGLREFAEETTTRFGNEGVRGAAAVTARRATKNAATDIAADQTVESLDDRLENPYASAMLTEYLSRGAGIAIGD